MTPLKPLAALAAALAIAGCGAHAAAPAATRTAASVTTQTAPASALQRHVMFFDRNGDGAITPAETREALAALGLSWVLLAPTALAIHAGLKGSAGSGNGLELAVAKIAAGKHGNDTGAYDAEGNFVSRAYERIKTFDANRSGSLDWVEIKAMIAANRAGTTSTFASESEFGLLLKLGADTTETEGGKPAPALSFDRLKAFYDGTLFYAIAKEKAKG